MDGWMDGYMDGYTGLHGVLKTSIFICAVHKCLLYFPTLFSENAWTFVFSRFLVSLQK